MCIHTYIVGHSPENYCLHGQGESIIASKISAVSFDESAVSIKRLYVEKIFCFFDLSLYVPVNNFSVMSGRVFLG